MHFAIANESFMHLDFMNITDGVSVKDLHVSFALCAQKILKLTKGALNLLACSSYAFMSPALTDN